MPDIRPDTPVAVLWPPGQDSYNGGRARSRLEAVNVTTVGQLCAMTAEDVTDIPRAGKTVLAEIRRALAANGLHLAGERAPSLAAVQAAIEQGQVKAARKTEREGRRREEPAPASRDDFTALVKDLRGELTDPAWRKILLTVPRAEHPRAFTGRPWAWRTVGPQGVSAVTGYSAVSVRRYRALARTQHAGGTADHRTMPLPDPKGRWVIGDLALWLATRNEAQAATIVVDDEKAAEILAGINAARGAGRVQAETYAAILADLQAAPRTAAGRLRRGEREGIAERHGVPGWLVALIASGRITPGTGAGRLPRRARKTIAREYGVSEELIRDLAAGKVPGKDRKGPNRARRENPKIRADDDEVAAFLAARIARTSKHVPGAVLLAEARAAGLPAATHQLRRLLPGIRAAEARRRRRPTGPQRARGESLRSDGLLYAGEVTADWAITRQALAKATSRGDVRIAGMDGRRLLYDGGRLRPRKDGRRTPVDKDHPLARLEPGDEGYDEWDGKEAK